MRVMCTRTGLASIVVLLAACSSPDVMQMKPVDTGPRSFQPSVETLASFECAGALPAVHQAICSSEVLARADKQLAALYRDRLRRLDVPGALLLEASQRQWQLSRAEQCGLNEAASDDAQVQACLLGLYRRRSEDILDWQAAEPAGEDRPHALASYAEYRLMDGAEAGYCAATASALNDDLRRHGWPNPGRLDGVTLLAGTHASANQASVDGRSVEVAVHDAGPFGGYEIRPRGLSVDGAPVADDHTLPRWVAEQPNYGGRAHASSSQTGDYGSLDVFERNGKTLVLISETWGFYSAAARGESAYAGLYELQDGKLQRRCLYQTYLTPPRTNTLAGLAVYSQLDDALSIIAGEPLPGYAQHERRDNYQSWKERQWTLLNLPLLGADGWSRYGRDAAIRERNDAVMEAFFAWSERNLRNKQIYRRVMPLLLPAHQELRGMYGQHGLSAEESQRAADLLLLETVARAMENLEAPAADPGMPPAAFAQYSPRFAIAPAPGDLEKGRQFSTLHSVVLNNAPLHVVQDFVDYESNALGAERGRGPDNDSATMAAVGNPETLALLLREGFDPDQRNAWGKTALMMAAQLDQAPSAELLLDSGADVHAHTSPNQGAGVGGPDRKEAQAARQTALLFAAAHAQGALIDSLLQAGAAREEWGGYDRQVCARIKGNPNLNEQVRATISDRLCATEYEPALTRAKPGNLRAGEVYVVRDGGQEYSISLKEREAMSLFGRPLQIAPEDLRKRLRKIGTTVGTAAVRRGGGKLTGPLTLVFDDLSANSEQLLKLKVSFPVSPGTTPVGGYTLDSSEPAKVLAVTFDPQRNDVEGTWRALLSAAYTQSFTPTGRGYVTIDIRGKPVTEYQLVVVENQQ
ncbi:Ankyrin repeat [Halopseudomonas xinjiangensis]|uniref:Ankyrin repeat n=1 Tax=Halopseudomonas xinjiangensis TaxID=487184 RepID=A0A1H1R708_9GAMM|nr:ankyrin repeat domain-containing protein [Halopseudomonas xinjiangensis]SDS31548.1 Ankyrin repeat [Halopseudomonas xinjiangensis]